MSYHHMSKDEIIVALVRKLARLSWVSKEPNAVKRENEMQCVMTELEMMHLLSPTAYFPPREELKKAA